MSRSTRLPSKATSPALSLLLDCGFDPNRGDAEIGKTALHSAAMAGQPEATRVLLERGASTDTRDRESHGQPSCGRRKARGRTAIGRGTMQEVGRLLLDAGSPVEWQLPTDEPAEGVSEVLAEWQRRRQEAVR